MNDTITAFWFDAYSDDIMSSDGHINWNNNFVPSDNNVRFVLNGYYFLSRNDAVNSRLVSINDEIKELEKRKDQLEKLLS